MKLPGSLAGRPLSVRKPRAFVLASITVALAVMLVETTPARLRSMMPIVEPLGRPKGGLTDLLQYGDR
jgi:hypothetical protein